LPHGHREMDEKRGEDPAVAAVMVYGVDEAWKRLP
jgi:hypothetical protein